MIIGAHAIAYSTNPEAAAMQERNVACGPVQDQGWGLLTQVTLPGGGELGIYQPRHARPKPMKVGKSKAKPSTRGQARSAAKGSKAEAPAKRKVRTVLPLLKALLVQPR